MCDQTEFLITVSLPDFDDKSVNYIYDKCFVQNSKITDVIAPPHEVSKDGNEVVHFCYTSDEEYTLEQDIKGKWGIVHNFSAESIPVAKVATTVNFLINSLPELNLNLNDIKLHSFVWGGDDVKDEAETLPLVF